MVNHTPEEIIGITLGFSVIALGVLTAARILYDLAVLLKRDLLEWWRLR
jgi:hypothetical protein